MFQVFYENAGDDDIEKEPFEDTPPLRKDSGFSDEGQDELKDEAVLSSSVNMKKGKHKEHKYKQPISGYIDFFDDDETSFDDEHSESVSRSISVQVMFDAIGLKSPPIENMTGLQSVTSSEDDGDEGVDGELDMMMDREFEGDSTDFDGDIEHEEWTEEGNIGNIDGIGLSSCIWTESADMMDTECLPQLMLKYTPSMTPNAQRMKSDIDCID